MAFENPPTAGTIIGALKFHSERSDCFRDASLVLQSSCESFQFNASERVRVAVEMTLCELATAEQVSLPLECKKMHAKPSQKTVSQCVELSLPLLALARSAQHWSSYSGYLREIPQLCTAYRRLHEIDHAKAIYANLTNEKISFLSSLNGHYYALSLRQRELSELNKIQAGVVMLSDKILAEARASNQRAFADLEGRLGAILSEVQADLSLVTKNTQASIDTTARSLDAVALSWSSRLMAFGHRLDIMWEETFDRKLALEQAIDNMRERVSQSEAQLELQLVTTEKLQTLSSDVSSSIEHANSQLRSASDELSQELGALISVTQELQKNVTRIPDLMPKFGSIWLPGIFSPLSSVWNG
ncbi:hypothetical protein RhiTH_006079 [Rhizoctonia solani]